MYDDARRPLLGLFYPFPFMTASILSNLCVTKINWIDLQNSFSISGVTLTILLIFHCFFVVYPALLGRFCSCWHCGNFKHVHWHRTGAELPYSTGSYSDDQKSSRSEGVQRCKATLLNKFVVVVLYFLINIF